MNTKPLKLVVLDGHTANPGDLNWSPITELGECSIYPRTQSTQLRERIQGAEAVLTNKVALDKTTLDTAPSLRYIGVMATGHDVVDVRAASENGIVVTNIPSYSTSSIAQGAIAFLLELTNNVGHHNQTVHDGKWCKSLDFCYWERPIIELKGLKLGVIGFGAIGRSVANIASALGMSILTNSRTKRESSPGLEAKFCDLETLLKESDVVTLHCPLTPQTIGLIGYKALGMMKKSAFLLNTARGGLIVEQDLADALNSGEIAGAALDVLSTEPPNESNPLFSARNCIITPHHCWASMATRKELLGQTAANLRAYLSGQPINVVNP